MIKNILLIRPPTTLPRQVKFYSGAGEPLGILYIAAVLERAGYKVKVLDALCCDRVAFKKNYITYGCGEQEIKEEIKRISPDIVGVSWGTSCNEADVFKVCKIVKSINKNIPVVVGGSYPTLFPSEVIQKPFVDYIILGEGEFRLLKLVELVNKRLPIDFDGIAFKKSSQVKINPLKEWIENLDQIPYPARHLVNFDKYERINFDKYSKIDKTHGEIPFKRGLILATRGCFGRCSFCSVSKVWGQRIRHRSVKNIIGEIQLLKNNYYIKHVFFADDNICVNKSFLKELISELKKINIKWEVPLGFHINSLDKEIIALLADSGISSVTLPIESTSERVLKEVMRKNVDLAKVKNIIKECHQYNLPVIGSFVVGMVGESKEDLLKTMNFAARAGFDRANLFVALPIPGTDFYNECLNKGYLPTNFKLTDMVWSDLSVLRIPKSSPDFAVTPKELQALIWQTSDLVRQRKVLVRAMRVLRQWKRNP